MDNKEIKDIPVIELRSEEVQELMDRKPSCILRYGIGVVLFLFVVLLQQVNSYHIQMN